MSAFTRQPFSPLGALCALSLVVFGCEMESTPTDAPTGSFSADEGVIESVTGAGHFTQNGEFRNFSLAALRNADGSVTGQFESTARDFGFRAHGSVTCLTIVGNAAWLGGTIEQFPANPAFEGLDASWIVVDNGSGAGDVDQISQAFPGPPGSAAQFCAGTPALPLNDVEAGSITVHK